MVPPIGPAAYLGLNVLDFNLSCAEKPSLFQLRPVQLMVAMLAGLLFSRLNSALGHLVKVTADLLFGAA
jgi:hypothetical protein